MVIVNQPNKQLTGRDDIFNRVKSKNLNLITQEYNTQTNKINQKGILFSSESLYKDAQRKRESIIARLDTDIHTNKSQGGYDSNIGVNQLNELTGTGKSVNINILRNKYVERGYPKKVKESKHKIEFNPVSMTVNKYRVERAIKNVKDYDYNKILNSVPINIQLRG